MISPSSSRFRHLPSAPLRRAFVRLGGYSLLLTGALAITAGNAIAADFAWNGAGGNALWSNDNNWTGTGVPGAADRAIFSENKGINVVIDLESGALIRQVLFDSNRASAYILGTGTASTQSLSLASGGSISVSSGVVNDQSINANLLLQVTGSSNGFNLTNNSTKALSFGGMVSGGGGSGTAALNVGGSGDMTFSGGISNGTSSALSVNLSGTGTTTLSGSTAYNYSGVTTVNSGAVKITGNLASISSGNFFLVEGGSVSLNSGGTITNSNGTLIVGQNVGKAGTLTISGAGSSATLSYLLAGNAGVGMINIGNGGTVASVVGAIGLAGTQQSEVSVSDVGSRWTMSGGLTVGAKGAGKLVVSNGAKVSNSFANIGQDGGSKGHVEVSGIGSEWTASDVLRIGNNGEGEVVVSGGGKVSTSNQQSIFIGTQSTGKGHLSVSGSGSLVESAGQIFVGNAGSGELLLGPGGTVVAANSINIAFGNNSQGVIEQNGGSLEVGGNLVIGANSGSTASYLLNSGTLKVGGANAIQSNTANYDLSLGSGIIQATSNLSTGLRATLQSGTSVEINSGAHTVSWSGVLAGSGGLMKSGTGRLVLTAENSFGGKTSITEGTVSLSGAGSLASGEIIVSSNAFFDVTSRAAVYQLQAGQVLQNNGTVVGALNVAGGATVEGGGIHAGDLSLGSGAVLKRGDEEVGTVTVQGTLLVSGGSELHWKVDTASGEAGVEWDLFRVDELDLFGLSAAQPLVITIASTMSPRGFGSDLYSFTILESDALITGFDVSAFRLDDTQFAATTGLLGTWEISNSDHSLILTYSAIPEPSGVALVIFSLSSLIWLGIRRKL